MAKINVTCEVCGANLRIEERHAGSSIPCLGCGTRVDVPGDGPPSEQPVVDKPRDTPRALEPRVQESVPNEPVSNELARERPATVVPPAARRPRPKSDDFAVDKPVTKAIPKLDMEELIDMTAMVDIVFFLLIFFLVTSIKQIDSTIPMPAPSASSAANGKKAADSDSDNDPPTVIVRIDQNDAIWVEDVEVRGERDLLLKLAQLRGNAGGNAESLMVVGHGDASHGMTVMVLDAGRQAGIDKIRLSVQDEAD